MVLWYVTLPTLPKVSDAMSTLPNYGAIAIAIAIAVPWSLCHKKRHQMTSYAL